MTTRAKLWTILAVVSCIVIIARAARKRHGSLQRNRIFAERVIAGANPYAQPPVHAPYPPSYGIVMAPLLLPGLTGARILWAMLQLTMLFVLARVCLRWWNSLPESRAPPPAWLWFAAFALAFRYFWRDTSGGGGNLVWGTLVALACVRPGEAAGADRRAWTGIGLGIVLGAKPTPLLFLPWLWMRGRRRTLALALATATALHLAPMLTLGTEGWHAAYAHWLDGCWRYTSRDNVFAEPAFDFPKFTWMHQSLRYAMARFLGTVPAGVHDADVLELPLFFQGLGLAPATIQLLFRITAATCVVTTLGVLFAARRKAAHWIELAGPGALTCLTLLLSPITWKAHHVQLLPTFFLVLTAIAHSSRGRTRRRVGLVLYFVSCSVLAQLLLGRSGKNYMQSIYVVTFGTVWLLVESLLLVALPSTRQEQAVGPAQMGNGSR